MGEKREWKGDGVGWAEAGAIQYIISLTILPLRFQSSSTNHLRLLPNEGTNERRNEAGERGMKGEDNDRGSYVRSAPD